MRILLVLLLSVTFLSACESKRALEQRYKNHVVRDPASWNTLAAKPVVERFAAANTEVLDYVTLDNKIFDYPERPTASPLSQAFKDDVSAALASIPTEVIALVDKPLKGIVFLDNLGSSGYTSYVMDENKEPVGAFIVMDTTALQRTANEWSSWKENTPFAEDAAIKIVSEIETPANNTRANAIRYILLHEFAHVLAADYEAHPNFDGKWDCVKNPIDNFPFLQFSWQVNVDTCKMSSLFDSSSMPSASKIRYYSAGGNVAASEAAPIYKQLKQTNFPSLYANTNWFDDFAESFVTYIHTQIDKRPFKIEIYEQGKLAETFNGCWNTPRCAQKQRLFEQLFNVSSSEETP